MRVVLGLLLALTMGACSGGSGSPDASPTDCGLIEPDPAADPARIPAPLLLSDGVEVATTEIQQGRLLAALNVQMTVDESFAAYKTALRESGFEILQEDNEGFEAELYVSARKKLGSLVIRRSVCAEAVVVYLNLPPDNE